MGDTNNSSESYPTQEDLHRDNHITDQLLISLGLPNSNERSFNEVNSLMRIYSPLSNEKNEGDKKYFENRNQYLLSSLIQTINYEPTEETFIELEIPQLRRTNAINILANNFLKILQKDPQGAHMIVEAVIQKLEKKDPNLMKMVFLEGEVQQAYGRETDSILGIIDVIADNCLSLNKETNRKIFKQLFEQLPTHDFAVGIQVINIMEKYFKVASSNQTDYSLFNTLLDDLIEQVNAVDTKEEKNVLKLVNIPGIYAYLLAKERYLIPTERLLVDRKIFDHISSYLKKNDNPELAISFLHPLRTIIEVSNKRADQSKELLEQQRFLDLEILRIGLDSIKEGEEIKPLDARQYFEGMNLLNSIFEKYIDGYIKENGLWAIHKDNESDIKKFNVGFQNLLDSIVRERIAIRHIPFLKDTSIVESPDCPFKKELMDFYLSYFTNLKKLTFKPEKK